ncbi:MAG: type III-B CRISPR module RAMP protein Cmr1 [Bacteroidetes bacterium]|nr:type III-B CRISPR module RAMP protein Cmr1 [Bacteroidota bacterium]
MEKITFECETITPMFLGGADGKTPELRPPSIKAAMRFWWRALNADLSIKNLRKKEAEIFGGSGEKEGRSKFNLRVTIIESSTKDKLKDKIWNSKTNKVKDEYEGTSYLFYSTLLGDGRPYFEKMKFKIEISSQIKAILKDMSDIFFVFSLLGSLGSRSRRGAGNFKILKVIENNKLINDYEFKSITNKEDLKRYFELFLKNLVKKCTTTQKQYSNLSSVRMFIFDSDNSATRCLEILGKNFKTFRTRRNPDYNTVKDFLNTGSTSKPIEKSNFGLPISYRYSSLKGKSATIEGSSVNERQRSASPVIFKVIECNNTGSSIFFPIIIIFERELLPSSDKVKIKDTDKKGNRPKNVSIPSNTIISDFIHQLPSNVEVII